jgi:putative ATP-binding cassette transporter
MNISKGNWNKYVYFTLLSIVAALGNMGVLYTINRVIKDYITDTPVISNVYLGYFAASVFLFITCRWLVSTGIIKFTQGLLKKTRLEVLRMVLKSPFEVLIKNKSKIYSALTTDTNNIVSASINIVDILTNVIVVLICFIYMLVLSWKLLLCVLGLIAFTLTIYSFCVKRAMKYFRLAMEQNDSFVRYLGEILSGFKEINIAPAKGTEITDQHITKAVETASVLNKKAQVSFLNNRIIGQVAFYIFIGIVMLFLGDLFSINKAVLVNFVFLILYTWGPIETVVLLVPNLSQARTSLKRINQLENQITSKNPVEEQAVNVKPFTQLELRGIGFEYDATEKVSSETAFCIGPVNFQVEKGDTVFISGGNGSGKTTFINILTGLMQRNEGDIYVNGNAILPEHVKSYKSLFAPVFSDCHLFDQFYGIARVDMDKANEYLRLFEIDNKVTVEPKGFSDIKLSTGQKKRLALICALLERKPILILDEFAADQDPHFKRKFYKEIIGIIKNEGFTLIAVTHDDNYYRYADRLYKMDSGKLSEVKFQNTDVIDLLN